MDTHLPLGWDYNPSSTARRVGRGALALAGLVLCRGSGLAAAFLVVLLVCLWGGAQRWRTPWLVGVTAGVIVATALATVVLMVLHVAQHDALSLSAFATALLGSSLVGATSDELLASLQHWRREADRGHPPWQTFWGTRRPQRESERERAARSG